MIQVGSAFIGYLGELPRKGAPTKQNMHPANPIDRNPSKPKPKTLAPETIHQKGPLGGTPGTHFKDKRWYRIQDSGSVYGICRL